MSNAVLQVIIMVIVILYCAYMLYSSLRLYKKDKAGAAEYMTVHPEARRVSLSIWQAWLLVGMGVLCFALVFFGNIITPEGQQVWMYQLTYFALGLVFLGLSLDVWLHRRLLLSNDGFFYAGDTYRFRMILNMEEKRGIFKNVKLNLANGHELEMANRVGMTVREDWLTWKEKKKEKRKNRRNR